MDVGGIAYTKYVCPRQYYIDSVNDFLKRLGEKTFWQLDSDKRKNVIDSLWHDYIRTEHGKY